MRPLDDPVALAAVDPGGMLQQVAALPSQLERAPAVAGALARWAAVLRAAHTREVVVWGMGGSAIGGDYAAAWAAQHGVRVSVQRDYTLPGWVDARHLLVFSSYSGDTEETLSAFAASRGCGGVRACITTGGRLGTLAREQDVPIVELPTGLQPRAALGHSLVALLELLHAAGLVRDDPALEICAAARHVRASAADLGAETPESRNRAKQLARSWHGFLPYIYTGSGILEPVGRRWKAQIHENAKAQAAVAALPEMNHNEIMAWRSAPELRERARLFFLRDAGDPEPVRRRMALTGAIVRDRVDGVDFIDSVGSSALERALHMTSLGDHASVYLAFLYEVDPSPVDVIEELKRRLARGD